MKIIRNIKKYLYGDVLKSKHICILKTHISNNLIDECILSENYDMLYQLAQDRLPINEADRNIVINKIMSLRVRKNITSHYPNDLGLNVFSSVLLLLGLFSILLWLP